MMEDIKIENVLATLSYLSSFILPIFGPILFLILFRDNYIKFHSLQALFINLIWAMLAVFIFIIYQYIVMHSYGGGANMDSITTYLDYLFTIIAPIYNIGIFFTILFGAYKASKGERFKFPIIKNIIEKLM